MHEVFELIARALAEFFIEVFIRSPGWMFLRIFRKSQDVQPDGCLVLTIGILFWVVAAGLICAALWLQ